MFPNGAAAADHQCFWALLARMVLLVLRLGLAAVTAAQTLSSNSSEPHSIRSDPSEGRLALKCGTAVTNS